MRCSTSFASLRSCASWNRTPGLRSRAVVDNHDGHGDPNSNESIVPAGLPARARRSSAASSRGSSTTRCCLCAANGVPCKALGGSTNFTLRGLYVQSNNTVVFSDAKATALWGCSAAAFGDHRQARRRRVNSGRMRCPSRGMIARPPGGPALRPRNIAACRPGAHARSHRGGDRTGDQFRLCMPLSSSTSSLAECVKRSGAGSSLRPSCTVSRAYSRVVSLQAGRQPRRRLLRLPRRGRTRAIRGGMVELRRRRQPIERAAPQIRGHRIPICPAPARHGSSNMAAGGEEQTTATT